MSTTVDAGEGESEAETAFSDPEVRDRLRELPPSAKLIAKVLEGEQPLPQGRLAEESLLPDRTVRYALNRLDEAGLVDARYSFRDARKQVYFLTR